MFVKYAAPNVVMQSGFGALDKMPETIALVQTDKTRRIPAFWCVPTSGKVWWTELKTTYYKEGMIKREDLDLFHILVEKRSLKDIQPIQTSRYRAN